MKQLLLVVCLLLSSPFFSQEINIQDLTAKRKKVFAMVNSQQKNHEDLFFKYLKSALKKEGYWTLVDQKSEADFILMLMGCEVVYANQYGPVSCFEVYPILYSPKEEPLWAGKPRNRAGTIFTTFETRMRNTVSAIVKELPSDLKKAKIGQTSPYYKDQQSIGLLPSKQNEYNQLLKAAFEEFEKENMKTAQIQLKKAFKIQVEPVAVHLNTVLNLKLRKVGESMKCIRQLREIDPFNPALLSYTEYAYAIKYEKDAQMINVSMAFSVAIQSMSQTLANYNNLNRSTINSTIQQPVNNSSTSQQGALKVMCHMCEDRAGSLTTQYMVAQNNPAMESLRGNGKCSSCKGSKTRESNSFGVYSIEKCSNCSGTGVCPRCNGTGQINK